MILNRAHHGRIALFLFALALLLAWCCYRPAFSGAFQLDDVANLGGLSRVSDFDSALDFTLSGRAGPLGRPIALATFAAQADSWERGARAFLYVNFLIHILNALLLALCAFRIALGMSIERTRALQIAVLCASTWVLMPLLATSTLLVVQRMTTLSATFVLAGIAGYLIARSRIATAPRRALVGMSVSLAAGTVLAMLTKESGVLLPVYALVLEATVLERPESLSRRHWRSWQAVFLLAPLAIIVLYLATRASYPDWIVARRGFTAAERLLTESRVLWLYVYKAVVGLPDRLGIFQYAPALSRSVFEPMTLLASVSWLTIGALAILWRRRYPLAALAALWFLAGHLLESTIVPLELYFEHRNYLPAVGPLFALSAVVLIAAGRIRAAALSVLLLLVMANAWFLIVFASLWGEPSLAARHWAMRYPDSVRAVTTLASAQLAEEGPLRTLQTIDNFVIRQPQHAYLRIQELNLLCRVAPQADHGQVLQQLFRELPAVEFTYTAGTMLSQLFDASVARQCAGVGPDTVAAVAEVLVSNPRYAGDPAYNQFHARLLAGIARHRGDFAATISHLQDAIGYRPSSELNMMMVTALAGAGHFDAAHEFIDDARINAPAHPLHAYQWRRDLDGLRAYVLELEKARR